jgi:hypothetical protein
VNRKARDVAIQCFENDLKAAGLVTSPKRAGITRISLVVRADQNGVHISRAGCVGDEN